MLHWLKQRWQRLARSYQSARDLSPREFARLAREVRDLAAMAEKLTPETDAEQAKLARIRGQMEQLDELTARDEFQRLPQDTRRQLRQGLLASRKQLLETVHNAPTPTDLLQ